MPTPMLPRLDDNATFTSPAAAGVWEFRGSGDLAKLAQSLKVDERPREGTAVYAIPNVWARVFQFQQALESCAIAIQQHVTNRPLLAPAEEALRGLLAAIALAEIKRFPISFEDVALDIKPDHMVVTTLRRLLPDDFQAAFQVILFGDTPIAITSPLTIVCPSFEADTLSNEDCPWFDNATRRFGDPTKHLSREDRLALAGWLRGQLAPIPPELNYLFTVLNRFALDLARTESRLSSSDREFRPIKRTP